MSRSLLCPKSSKQSSINKYNTNTYKNNTGASCWPRNSVDKEALGLLPAWHKSMSNCVDMLLPESVENQRFILATCKPVSQKFKRHSYRKGKQRTMEGTKGTGGQEVPEIATNAVLQISEEIPKGID